MNRFKRTMMAGFVLIPTLLNADRLSAQTASALFTDADSSIYIPKQHNKPAHIIRERYVRLNSKLVKSLIKAVSIDSSGNPPDVQKVPKMTFNLFPDANYVSGEVTEINDTVVAGKLANETGFFQLVISEQFFVAHISVYHPRPGEFEISSTGNDLYKIMQINQAKFAPD